MVLNMWSLDQQHQPRLETVFLEMQVLRPHLQNC